MHIFSCFAEGFYPINSLEESDFLAKLSEACGATVSRSEGCTESEKKVIFTVFDIPAEKSKGKRRPKSPNIALRRIAREAKKVIDARINHITVIDTSGHLDKYQTRVKRRTPA